MTDQIRDDVEGGRACRATSSDRAKRLAGGDNAAPRGGAGSQVVATDKCRRAPLPREIGDGQGGDAGAVGAAIHRGLDDVMA